MPKIASILAHNNAFAPTVDSNTIRGGLRTKIDTAANLAALFDPDAALQSTNNSQDLLKEKATIVYVEDKSDYYILNDATASDVAPDEAGSGWIKLLGAIGGGTTTDATDSTAGVVELATDAETNLGTANGTDAALVVTPANLQAFEGSANLDTLGSVVVAGSGTASFNGATISAGIIQVNGIINNNSAGILFQAEGETDDGFETYVKVVDPTADRNIFLPNASGNVVLTGGVTGDISIAADYEVTIAEDAVTYAKMQNVSATNRLLGRDSAGQGVVEEIAPGDVLTMLGVESGANAYAHPTQDAITVDSDTTELSGAAVISDVDIDISVNTLGHVTAATYTTATRTLTLGDLGYTGDTNAEANVGTNLAVGTNNGTTQEITSSTGDNVSLVAATASLAGIVTNDAQTFAGNKSFSNNVSVGGNLTVQGDFIQETSTNVIFEDTFLDLNVPDTATADITSDSGLRFGTAASTASVLNKHAQLMYDATADKFKFTREQDAGDWTPAQAKSGADNVAALKFTKTDTNTQADQANGTTTMAAADEANASSVRSLGAVAKCSITITTDAANDGDNYAPAEAGAAGYPIKHNLGTQSVFVVAIQTVNNSGSAMADPQPVYCKYIPEDDNTVRVSVGVTQVTEQYDIIVIG